MTQEDLEILKQDFHDWLTHPLTDTFLQIISTLQARYIEEANQRVYKNYHKKELDEITTLLFGKADGIETMMSVLIDCRNNKPAIDELFKETIEHDEKN